MLYTLTEFMTKLKQDLGLRDLPKPVTDQDLIDRLGNSAIKLFSIFQPKRTTCRINENELVENMGNSKIYRIPMFVYAGSSITRIIRADPIRSEALSDMYAPYGYPGGADSMLGMIADYRLAATMQQSVTVSMTFEYLPPDKVRLYNGWLGGAYEITVGLCHDVNLTTIPDTAMHSFIELAQLDMAEYLYNVLKRKEGINTGSGEIQLKIDEWSNAAQEKKALLKEWANDASLDFDTIAYF